MQISEEWLDAEIHPDDPYCSVWITCPECDETMDICPSGQTDSLRKVLKRVDEHGLQHR